MLLENEGRIVAMVMELALMVYSAAGKKLRDALENANETIPDQRKKQTRKKTMRRVFQVFEDITVLYRGLKVIKVLNVRPIHKKKSSQCSVVIMSGGTAPVMDRGYMLLGNAAMQSGRRKTRFVYPLHVFIRSVHDPLGHP
jgi:hypothetical protein